MASTTSQALAAHMIDIAAAAAAVDAGEPSVSFCTSTYRN